jgi:hypothetical protein
MRRSHLACFMIWPLFAAQLALAQHSDLPTVPPPPPGYGAPPPMAGPPAQTGTAAPETPTPATPAAQTLAEPQAAPPATTEPTCIPACRSGYVCVQGQCVSACNPPCSAGQTCTPDAQCLATPPLFAPPATPNEMPSKARPADPTAQLHDGFMARATIGLGGASVKTTTTSSNAPVSDFSGAVLGLSLDVGGAPTENLVLHGRLADMTVLSPRARIQGVNQPDPNQSSADVLLLAPAITYYVMPINIYATGAVGFSWLFERYRDILGDDHSYRTKAGVGLNIDLGKEWWVNEQWGFGAAGRFWYTLITADNRDTVTGFALLFSATYQ